MGSYWLQAPSFRARWESSGAGWSPDCIHSNVSALATTELYTEKDVFIFECLWYVYFTTTGKKRSDLNVLIQQSPMYTVKGAHVLQNVMCDSIYLKGNFYKEKCMHRHERTQTYRKGQSSTRFHHWWWSPLQRTLQTIATFCSVIDRLSISRNKVFMHYLYNVKPLHLSSEQTAEDSPSWWWHPASGPAYGTCRSTGPQPQGSRPERGNRMAVSAPWSAQLRCQFANWNFSDRIQILPA